MFYYYYYGVADANFGPVRGIAVFQYIKFDRHFAAIDFCCCK